MRILAIDYGEARTGVAVSDPTGLLAGSAVTIHSRRPEEVLEQLVRLAGQYQAEELVVGLPRNMDGSDGRRAGLYRDLAAALEARTGARVVLWDERRTTIDAHQILRGQGKNARKRKALVDAVAASLILESYLDFKRLHPAEK